MQDTSILPQKQDDLIDRPLPHDEEAEKAVLGAILNFPEVTEALAGRLRPADFYTTAHEKIFRAAIALHERQEPVDVLTLANELCARDELEAVGSRYYLTALSAGAISAVNTESHVRIVLEKSQKRRRIKLLHLGITGSLNGADERKFAEILTALEATKQNSHSQGRELFVVASPPDSLELVALIENFAVERCVTLLAGKSGSYKSLYIQVILNRAGLAALYLVDFDLSNYLFHVRQKAMSGSSVIPVAIEPNSNLVASFRLPQFWAGLAQKLKETGARVIVFDTLLDFLEGDFNRASDLNISMQRCRDFAAKHNVAVILITHTAKISWNKDELELSDVADSRVITTKCDLVWGFQSDGNLLKMTMLKNRIGPKVDPVVFKIDTPETHPAGIFDFTKTREQFPSRESAAVEKAALDLTDFLQAGKQTAADCQSHLESLGHTTKIIRTAREKVCKRPVKDGAGWVWELDSGNE